MFYKLLSFKVKVHFVPLRRSHLFVCLTFDSIKFFYNQVIACSDGIKRERKLCGFIKFTQWSRALMFCMSLSTLWSPWPELCILSPLSTTDSLGRPAAAAAAAPAAAKKRATIPGRISWPWLITMRSHGMILKNSSLTCNADPWNMSHTHTQTHTQIEVT